MAVPAVLVVLPIGTLFILSGFIINFFQAFFFILVRPVSKNTYRRINKVIAELLWLELIWLIDWWAGIKVEMHTDLETSQLLACRLPWQCSGHNEEVKILPIIGWSMWFCGYIFLERRWTNDESTLKSGFRQLEDFPVPFWMALFVEGTRFTQHKLALAQEFAASRGLPVPRNVLIPRTKGFVAAVSHMRSFVPAIYDCTIAIPKNQPPPTMLRLFRGQTSVVGQEIPTEF